MKSTLIKNTIFNNPITFSNSIKYQPFLNKIAINLITVSFFIRTAWFKINLELNNHWYAKNF
jgi:hypothetical protein